jgi:hypothetical protein
MWKKIFFFVAFPIIVIGNVNAFVMVDGTEMDPPAYVPYDHLRIRTKVKETIIIVEGIFDPPCNQMQ